MMKSEFCERTGVLYESISGEEYDDIETAYYDYPGDKNAFCEAWKAWKASGAWEYMRSLMHKDEEPARDNIPDTYAEIEYTDPYSMEAYEGCRFDDMNYLRYRER